MKRFKMFLSIVIVLIVILNCSLLDPTNKFSPPEWIQGTWSDTLGTIQYTFEADNVTQTIAGYSINFGLVYLAATVTESSSDTLYEFSINQVDAVASYTFSKTSATTLDYTITASGTTSPAVELTKE